MSRQLRNEIENGIYHVTARGWERRVMVRDGRDREKRSTVRRQLLFRTPPSHRGPLPVAVFRLSADGQPCSRLFFQTPVANFSAGMYDLNSGYNTWFNRRHRRAGALFQGRFKAILVEVKT